jgi:hypothetical protein
MTQHDHSPGGEREGSKGVERRLSDLETSVDKLWKARYDGLKWWVTIVFTLIAVFVTYLQFSAKSDVKDAINTMRADFEKQSAGVKADFKDQADAFQKQFAALSGDALKKPLLHIYNSSGLLDGQTVEVRAQFNFGIGPFFVKNDGDKQAEITSVRLYCSGGLQLPQELLWQQLPGDDKDYPLSFFYQTGAIRGVTISPTESWTLQGGEEFWSMTTNIVACKMLIFYGADRPAEARFHMKLKQ